jgi:hypothetical protein
MLCHSRQREWKCPREENRIPPSFQTGEKGVAGSLNNGVSMSSDFLYFDYQRSREKRKAQGQIFPGIWLSKSVT